MTTGEEIESHITEESIRINAKVDVFGVGWITEGQREYFKQLSKSVQRMILEARKKELLLLFARSGWEELEDYIDACLLQINKELKELDNE